MPVTRRPRISTSDEGVFKGDATAFNFVGSAVSANVVNGLATVTITASTGSEPGGSGGITSLVNEEDDPVLICSPVYISSPGQFKYANAKTSPTQLAVGLVVAASIASGDPGNIGIEGAVVTATTEEWDAVTGDTGGLTPGALYYLNSWVGTGAGLTTVVPSAATEYLVEMGIALSATDFLVRIQPDLML